jgi:hypothetical protein
MGGLSRPIALLVLIMLIAWALFGASLAGLLG